VAKFNLWRYEQKISEVRYNGRCHALNKIERNRQGLRSLIPEIFKTQVLSFFTHSDHKAAFSVMFDEKSDSTVDFLVERQKGDLKWR
jgi:hypothetical protein